MPSLGFKKKPAPGVPWGRDLQKRVSDFVPVPKKTKWSKRPKSTSNAPSYRFRDNSPEALQLLKVVTPIRN